MTIEIAVENIKCGGCANSIRNQLLKLEGIQQVEVDIEQGVVSLEPSHPDKAEALREQAAASLLALGYPQVGSVEGLRATGAKAKSFVSCAVGKITDKH